jgi:CubicO group peptidase (beta-lactamase class C family)
LPVKNKVALQRKIRKRMFCSAKRNCVVCCSLLVASLAIVPATAFAFDKENAGKIKTLSGKEITAAEMDEYLKAQMDSLNVKGISIAIINDAKVVYHRAFGIADVNSLDTVDDQTLFQAASISKPMFAYFVMKMVEKGSLDLDTPLFKYLPYADIEDDPRYKLITARIVLCHKTGFPNWRPGYVGKLKMEFTPGAKFSYSGEGYVYLAKVTAHLTNTGLSNLDSIFQQEVCKPLNVNHAYFGMNDYVRKHLARGHDGNTIHEDLDFIKNFNSAGGLCTEAVSFSHFLIAIMNDEGLKRESVDEMLKAQVQLPEDDNQKKFFGVAEWSLGFCRKPSQYGINLAHGGNNWGFSSSFLMNKEKKFGYVFFTNSNSCHFPGCPELWKKLEPYLIDGSQ